MLGLGARVLLFGKANAGESAPSMVGRGRDTILLQVFQSVSWKGCGFLFFFGLLCANEVLHLPKTVV